MSTLSPLSGLLVGAALGFVLQRGRFCVTGALREVWTSRSTRWLTAYLIAIAVSSIGFFLLRDLGVVHDSTTELSPLATIIGALVFGFGIVLAGGCATGTYYRSGEGLIGSWLALIMYVLSAAAMKHGILAPVNDGLKDANTLPVTTAHSLLGISPWILVAVLVAVTGWLTARHLARERKLVIATLPPQRTGLAHWLFEKPWHPFVSAVLVGLIGIAAYPLSYAAGRESGLGITTPSSDLAVGLVTGDASRLFGWGPLLLVGIIAGSFVAAKASGEFRLRVPDETQMVKSLLGGTAMGVGASLAGGCTIGGSLVGSAEMSLNGWLSFLGFFLGVGLAAKLFLRPPAKQLRTSAPANTAAPVHV